MNMHPALISTFTVSLTDSEPGYVRKQTKGASVTWDTDPKTTQWLVWSSTKKSYIVEDYTTERGARRRSFDAIDEQIGGVGELQFAKKKRENMEILFVLSLKGANDEIPVPLCCRERKSAQMWSGTSYVSWKPPSVGERGRNVYKSSIFIMSRT